MIRNLAEDHVLQAYESLRRHFPEFCGCDVCRADVLVFTLNRTPPRYVATLEGSVVTEVNLEKEQSRAPMDVAMMEAFRKVSLAPRCEARGAHRRV
jgi:competence protein ComFB